MVEYCDYCSRLLPVMGKEHCWECTAGEQLMVDGKPVPYYDLSNPAHKKECGRARQCDVQEEP